LKEYNERDNFSHNNIFAGQGSEWSGELKKINLQAIGF
jgi:hypothetical protein